MKMRKNYEICLLIVGCILINYVGKLGANLFSLPFWFDSIGTVFAAYVYGPFCGAVVGATGNIISSLHFHNDLFYGLTNIMVGITVGLCAKKGFLKNIFGVLSTAFLVTIFSVMISVPLNFIFADGSTENIWGDGVTKFLQEMGWNKIISCIIGEFYLDFSDKVLTILLLYFVIRLYRWKREGKKTMRKKKRNKKIISAFLLLQLFILGFAGKPVYAEKGSKADETEPYEFQSYMHTIFNGENGLPGGASNAIAQTKDGILWIGTYGGLYSYSGNSFRWMNEFESVKTVNCLYTDEAGRLWIGTNDDGISICINQEIVNVVSKEDGLSSNSVRCITESSDGYYYVGTTDSLVILDMSGGLKVYDTISEIVYAESICADQDGNVAVVNNEGDLFLLKGNKTMKRETLLREGEVYNCCAFDEEGTLYVGTSENRIEMFKVEENELKKVKEVSCGTLVGINSIYISEKDTVFACADNGVGYLDYEENYVPLNTRSFNSSIDNMLFDYQGNLWFTSSRLGLLRLCPTVFSEIYEVTGLPEAVVNAVIKWQGCMYYGTDGGLDIVTQKNEILSDHPLATLLEGVRIRCFMVDSKNHLWICTSSKGVLEVAEDGAVMIYDSTKGALGDKFRSIIEMKDGTMAVAGDSGLTFIKNGMITSTMGSSEGLVNPRILSLYEKEDGRLLVGTDGNGIAIVKNGKLIDTKKRENGLSSEVILRMVPDEESGGLFIVTGNGLCYMNEKEEIRFLDNFPYFNNYDLIEGEDELFVLGSAGIFVVDRKDLIQGKNVTYDLLDTRKGLRENMVPNSWNYIDENHNLYLCGDRGVVRMNLEQYDIGERTYRILLQELKVDGVNVPMEKGEPIMIPRGSKKIEFFPEVVNFSINDPDIRVYLEGFDGDVITVPQSELTSIVYTNLPSGEYRFHIAILDSRTGEVIAENVYQISIEVELYDHWWFKVYVGVVAVIVIAYLTWLFFRTQIHKTLRMQKMELELTKKQLQMGNETIFTIARAVDAKDENTSQHSARVSEYSVMIAKRLGYSEEACEELRKIAILHDIGKIGIPDYILNKPAKLTDEEYEIMKSHVKRGEEILRHFTLIDHVTDGALYHHERYDGRGYVHGLKGEEIPLNARIIGIADAFDAMTANRVYRKKLDIEHVIGELKKGRGTQFDPDLVDILLSLIEDGTIDVEQIYGEAIDKE